MRRPSEDSHDPSDDVGHSEISAGVSHCTTMELEQSDVLELD